MTEGVFRYSQAGDVPALKALWHIVFGDDLRYLDGFYRILYMPERCGLVEVDGEIISAAYLIPGARYNDKSFAYLFAVATYEKFRGRGYAALIAKRLCDDAFSSGTSGIATLPATPELISYYKRSLGMSEGFKKKGEKNEPHVSFENDWKLFSDFHGKERGHGPARLLLLMNDGSDTEKYASVVWPHVFE